MAPMAKKTRTKYRIVLESLDKNVANNAWLKIKAEQIGFKMMHELVEEPLYPIARVAFDNTSKRYTYRLSDELATDIEEGRKEKSRDWPTQYGLSYGTTDDIMWLTREEANELYPFEKITVVNK
jgi:hypothetical protein